MVYSCRRIFFFFFYLFQSEGKGGEKRGRETSTGCLLHIPQPGTEPAAQACALTSNQTCELLVCGTMPNQLSHISQGEFFFLSHQSAVKWIKIVLAAAVSLECPHRAVTVSHGLYTARFHWLQCECCPLELCDAAALSSFTHMYSLLCPGEADD